MSFVFDTTALSELTKKYPNEGFLQWLSSRSVNQAYIGAPSIGELEIGIELLAPSKKRQRLERWFEKLAHEFEGRILPFDTASARLWGRAVADARRKGDTLPGTDSQIAAIAAAHGLPIVTRNVPHFDRKFFGDLQIINPWT